MSTNANLYVTSLVEPLVKVTSLEDASKFNISWSALPGATGYKVFAGFDPFHIKSLISGLTALSNSTLSYDFTEPSLPPTQIVYYWVGGVVNGSVQLIDEVGSYHLRSTQYGQFHVDPFSDTSKEIMCGDDQLYYIEEMRRRAKAISEDTSEEVDIAIKQWCGLPDPTTQSELGLDPNYQGMTRNDDTYGVGFYPGFFPFIRARMRFGGLPMSQLDYQVTGLRPLASNEAWTLWDPLLHENDLIIRPSTGNRYVIKQIAFSNYRGVPITQRLTLEMVNPTSPLMRVTDADLWSKWQGINGLDYLRIGMSVMPDGVTGGTGPSDYLLFG